MAEKPQDQHLLTAVVDERLPTPLYHQIYVLLREKILSGAYPKNMIIPSEHELERMFGVSRITAKRALDELASEGLVTRQRGRGTRVIFSTPASPIPGSMEGLLENLLMMGLKTEVVLLELDLVPASPSTADALQLTPGALVQKAVRIRKKDATPFSYLVSHIPEDIGQSITREDMASTALLALLERQGVKVHRAQQTITATLADSKISPILGVQVGSPLLKISRVVFDQNDRPVQHIIVFYRPDIYQLTVNLTRVNDGKVNTWTET